MQEKSTQKIIYCNQCEHFAAGKNGFFCKNTSGMAYPGPGDFCSKAKASAKDENGNYTLESLLSIALDMRAAR